MPKEFHHYIPQCYLRGFTIEGEKSLIWEYDKEEGIVSTYPKSVRNICGNNFYYAFTKEDGKVDNVSLEDAFGIIEDAFSKSVRKINPQFNKNHSIIKVDEEDIQTIAFFIAL